LRQADNARGAKIQSFILLVEHLTSMKFCYSFESSRLWHRKWTDLKTNSVKLPM